MRQELFTWMSQQYGTEPGKEEVKNDPVYDGAEKKESVSSLLATHIDHFIAKEHICCAMSGKQSVAKKEWLRQRFDVSVMPKHRGRKVFAFCARRGGSVNFSPTRNSLHTRGSVWQTYPTAGSISCTFPLNRVHNRRISRNVRNIRRLKKQVCKTDFTPLFLCCF